jgi:hypothetical protein
MMISGAKFCCYYCLNCCNYLEGEPVGPGHRLEDCPYCQQETIQVRHFTAAEMVTLHEMLAAWNLEYGEAAEEIASPGGN